MSSHGFGGPLARRLRDLALGARFAVSGGPGWTRTLLTAAGVGLGVIVLLLAASTPHTHQARSERLDARSVHPPGELPAGPGTVLVVHAGTEYRGTVINGWKVQPDAGAESTAEPPPGLDRFPAPGEMVVSPALGELLDSARGALLAERLAYERAGTIGDQGLSGPGELFYYLGDDSLTEAADGSSAAMRVAGFGDQGPVEEETPTPPALVLLVVVLCVVLLMPVAVFLATAVRFGGERRDRRLAALRLIGADIDMARRIAAGEALVGALFGLLFGVLGFLGLRQYLGTVTVWEFSAYPSDIQPAPLLVALILCGVPFTAVAVSLLALRGVEIEPLGVVRDSVSRPRRFGWRLLPAALGLLLLLPMNGSFDGDSRVAQFQAAAGVLLLLGGATMLLPWLVERVVGGLAGGPVSWQLATRRLQLSSGAATRAVSGITVAVAGATALYMLFGAVREQETRDTGEDPSRAQVSVSATFETVAQSRELLARLEHTPGVSAVYGTISASVGGSTYTSLHVGDCAALVEMAHIDRCADGDVFLIADGHEALEGEHTPAPGDRVELVTGLDETGPGETGPGEAGPGGTGPGEAEPASWTVPATARTVEGRPDATGVRSSGVLATPAALDADLLPQPWTDAALRLDPDHQDAIELVRNVVWDSAEGMAWTPDVWELERERPSENLQDIQQALLIGATGVMTLIAASMLISMLEQLRERRRLLSVLVAFGTRRSTLGASVLWQTAVPVALGLVLASVAGTGLGALLMTLVDLPVTGWLAFVPLALAGCGMIALVTLVSMPLLWRLMRPDGLRTE